MAGVKIRVRKKIPLMWERKKNPNFNGRIFKTEGGFRFLKKCLNYKLLSDPILKMKINHLIYSFSM